MKHKHCNRLLSLLLVIAALCGILVVPSGAASLNDSRTVTIQYLDRKEYLDKSTGGSLGGSSWGYTSNDGLTGTAYCVNWGLTAVSPSKALPLEEYNRNPQTMGVFANGYPMRTLEQFKELHQGEVRGLDGLTEEEYKYATQVAIWSSCGQLAVSGTSFTAGRASLVEPTADAQKIRIYDTVVTMLKSSAHWSKNLYTGMSLRAEEDQDIRGVEVLNEDGLEGAAVNHEDGIKKETINGKEYYTRVVYLASATSTYIDDYTTKVYSTDAPAGTIFVSENNSALETVQENGATCYKVDTSNNRSTSLNSNGEEYYGAFKVCIPVDNAAAEGSFTIKATGGVAQYNLFLAHNTSASEQSYIVADPGYTTLDAQIPFKWTGMDVPDTASLQVVKAGAGGSPLEGAKFTLTGDKGTTVNGTTDRNGQIIWTDLPADEKFSLAETEAPEGYQIVAPMNVTLTAGRTEYLTVSDSVEQGFTIKKVDAQNKSSLQGAVFLFEQIDGSFKTTGTTGFDGTISFQGDELPYGSYRISEQSSPEGYVKSSRVETVEWDGTKDVTITWENVRDISLTIVKVDEQTGVSLPNATFDVYADGELITSVTTNDAGEAYVTGIKKEAYIEVVEATAPVGYVLDRTSHGIHIDPYDPTIEDDPVLTVTNRARPALRILKYDLTTKAPMPNVTFEVWHDGQSIGQYTTGENGDIFLYDLEPGTYLVKEVATDDAHVVNSTPQQIELVAGDTQTRELVFFNSLKPGIHLVKVDSVTMKSLPNVRFEFKKVGGSYRQEFTTDINGEIDLSKLEPGAYEVRELEAADGYLMDDSVRIVQVNPDENANFVFTNTPKPSLRLIKTSSDGTRLAGVHFRIAKIEDGSHYLDRITDDKGEINISDLEPGVYSVKETATTSDHVLDLREYHVELFPGQTSTITIENQKRPNLTIRKTDKDTGEPVPGVTFTLRGADGPTITTEPTGPDGTVTISNLLPGVYTVSEQSVPENYILDTTPQTITLFANREATMQFQNYKRPTLTISKVDINGNLLPGAIFEVKTKAGVKIGDFPVGPDGTVTIPNIHLDEGYYLISEKQAPEGFILDSTPHEVYLRPGKNTEISIENEKKPGLTIYKIDSVVGDGIKGAKFKIYVSKDKTENGTYQELDSSFYYTDSNGIIHLDNLDTGWYKIVEVEPAAGFSMKEPHEQIIYVEHDKSVEVTFENTPLNAIIVQKYDSVTGAAIQGATFQLRYLAGTSGTGGTVIGQQVTSKNGTAMWTGLKPGTYVLEELDPADGYSIIQSSETVFLADSGEQSVVTVIFQNAPDGSLLIRKVCAVNPGTTLQDAEFKITYSDGTLIGDSNGIFVTDENGEIRIDGLKPGKSVVVTETKAPDGFIIDTQSQTIQIKEGRTVSLTFKNQPMGSLIIQKRDSITGQPLPGAEFRVTTAAGCEVGLDGVIGSSTLTQNGIFTTDSNGEIRISNLAPGALVVTEVRAPNGYVMDSPSTNVVIGTNGDTQTVVITNTPKGGLLIRKIDSVTGKALPGVKFKIVAANGELVPDNEGQTSSNGIYTTDENGQIYLQKLNPNTYVVTEIETVDGYLLDAMPQTVVVSEADTQVLTFTNMPLGGLLVKKMDSATKEPLADVIFKITRTDGTVVGNSNGEYRTDERGYISLPDLEPGSYIVREVQAKMGYLLDDTPHAVEIKDHQTYTLEVFNQPLGNLIINKLSSADNSPLEGVKFQIKYANGQVVDNKNGQVSSNGIYYTDRNGQIILSGITGTVVVTELETLPGYTIDPNTRTQTVVINPNDTQTINFYNTPTTTLIIRKFVEGTENEPLSGVAFRVVDGAGAAVGPDDGLYYTDKSGEIVLAGIEPGTVVIVREVKTVEGYVLDGTPQDIKIEAGHVQQLTFWNKKAGTLVVQKKDSVSGALIAGAQFQLTYANGGFVDNDNGHLSSNGLYVTDDKGEIRITGITGTVVAKEVQAAPGYVIDSSTQTQTVTVNPMDTQTLTFLNAPLCSLTLTKLDSVSGKPVPKTEFTVKDGNGNVVGKYVTGADGTVVVTGLIPGNTYIVSESRVPAGYVLDPTPQYITVYSGTGNSWTSGGTGGSPSGGSSGSSGNSGNSGSNGLVFENDPTTTLVIEKYIAGTTTPLKGVTFLITDSSGAVLGSSNGEYITDENGRIVIEDLEPGVTVTAKEIRTVEGYILDTTPKTIKIKVGEAQTLRFYNDPAGTLVIRKLDKLTGEPLAGVEFELTYAEGGYVDNANGHLSSNGRYTTNDAGEIRISGVVGTIVVKEVKCLPGYTIDPATQTQTVTVNAADTQTLTFYNVPGTTLTIQKLITGTKDQPLAGVEFLITDSSGAYIGPNNGIYRTDEYGRITLTDLKPGTVITAKETATVDGYVLDGTPKSIEIKEGEAQMLTFYNAPIGGLELIKVSEADKSKRIKGVTFEIRKMDGALVDTVTTGDRGRVHVSLDAGDYYCEEIEAAEGFKIDTTPHYFTIRDNETTTLTVTNAPFSGIILHKIDSVTGFGIYDVKFLVYDENKNPIGEYTTDDQGYIYIDDLTVQGKGKLFIRELEAAPGYELDKQYKTVYVQPGKTIEIEWENTPITGQFQIYKYAAEYNEVTGTPAGTPLQGAVYEISEARSGRVVDYITTDARGVAASKPLPLGRYKIVEVTAPAYWQVSGTVFDETLEYSGQIIKVSDYDKPSNLGVVITKRGNAETLAGSQMRYDFTVANTSNVPLENFYWHDRIPTDAATATVLTTGTYSFRLNYRILYKTNYSTAYQVLASNLITNSSYSFSLNAIPTQAGEYVTDIYFDFGKVPVGFQSVSNPTLTVVVSGTAASGYQLINRADVGGQYQGTWQTGQATWVTIIRKLTPTVVPTLPKTGY